MDLFDPLHGIEIDPFDAVSQSWQVFMARLPKPVKDLLPRMVDDKELQGLLFY